ncbi:MAG: DNA replication/repair protein RecF [Lagierella massiliensis]|nr:DNA replication/repair protein RecF [Lagierella massiliensis]
MKILSCYLLNFRNFNNLNIRFFEKLNIIIGDNAKGKTNILEALYFSAKGKSFKSAKQEDLIKLGKMESFIRTDIDSSGLEEKIEVKISRNSQKIIRINENKIDTMKTLRSFFDIVTFTPEDIKIIKESKSFRREFLDEVISGIIPSYENLLIKYNKILNQRNYILKNNKNISYFKEQVQASTKQLAQEGAKIMRMRSKYIFMLEEKAKLVHDSLTYNKEKLDILYNKNSENSYSDINNNYNILYKGLQDNLNLDLNRGFTSVGPHRDDISILVNGLESRVFLSQGQQRTLTLTLKLAQTKLYDEIKESSPIILLDDVFSELDDDRINYLLKEIKDYQCIITSTDEGFIKNYNGEYRIFEFIDDRLEIKKFR